MRAPRVYAATNCACFAIWSADRLGIYRQGVDVQNVTRIYDQYLSIQVLQEQSQATYLNTYHTALKQIDNLVADPTAGASPAMQSFFDAMSAVSNNPESVPSRQTMLGNAQFAVNRFQAINQRMTDIANGLNGQITNSVNAVNSYAQKIAALNDNISVLSPQCRHSNPMI